MRLSRLEFGLAAPARLIVADIDGSGIDRQLPGWVGKYAGDARPLRWFADFQAHLAELFPANSHLRCHFRVVTDYNRFDRERTAGRNARLRKITAESCSMFLGLRIACM